MASGRWPFRIGGEPSLFHWLWWSVAKDLGWCHTTPSTHDTISHWRASPGEEEDMEGAWLIQPPTNPQSNDTTDPMATSRAPERVQTPGKHCIATIQASLTRQRRNPEIKEPCHRDSQSPTQPDREVWTPIELASKSNSGEGEVAGNRAQAGRIPEHTDKTDKP